MVASPARSCGVHSRPVSTSRGAVALGVVGVEDAFVGAAGQQRRQLPREDDLVPYLRDGERVRIEVQDAAGASLFGAIDQRVRVGGR
jgi:fumarylacetoacetate (FAA) hydrolase